MSAISDKKQLVIEETTASMSEDNEPGTSWTKHFFAKDYPRASELLQDTIVREKDLQKRTELRGALGHVMFAQDKQKGIEYFDTSMI